MGDIWADLKLVLTELSDDPSQPLQAYPDPRVDRDRQPPFDIQLQPWATDVAARLHERFGDGVRLTVGALSYPDPTSGKLPTVRELPLADPSVLTVALKEPATVVSGYSATATLVVTNTGTQDIALRTTGQLVGLVLDPETLAVVGSYAGARRLRLVVFRAAPGEAVEVPLLVGTASYVPELGYAVPPGAWAMEAVLDPSGRQLVRTPALSLTVT